MIYLVESPPLSVSIRVSCSLVWGARLSSTSLTLADFGRFELMRRLVHSAGADLERWAYRMPSTYAPLPRAFVEGLLAKGVPSERILSCRME